MFEAIGRLFHKPKVVVEKPEEPYKLFVIETLSSHIVRYVVECKENELDKLIIHESNIDDLTEFSQEFLGDKIVSYHTVNGGMEGYLKLFDENNSPYAFWDEDTKLGLINRK